MKKILPFLVGILLVATPAFAQGFNEITSTLQNLGFGEILIWLLSFAVVYGVLSHVGEKGMPKSKASRAIISIVLAFLVLMAVPGALINVLSNLARSLVLVIVGLLVLIVVLEFAGIKAKPRVLEYDEKGKPKLFSPPVSFFEGYGRYFGIALVLIAILLFVGSGGLQLLGVTGGVQLSSQALTSIIIIIVIVLAVAWIIAASGEK